MVELVDDHHVERVLGQGVDALGGQRLDVCEHVVPGARLLPVSEPLTKAAVAQRHLEQGVALLQDLAPMGDEQQSCARELVAKAAVVERGDDGLARARGCHDQVVAVPGGSLGL